MLLLSEMGSTLLLLLLELQHHGLHLPHVLLLLLFVLLLLQPLLLHMLLLLPLKCLQEKSRGWRAGIGGRWARGIRF